MDVSDVVTFAKKHHLDSGDLYMEAELVEQEGAWLHMELFGVGPKVLRAAAEKLEEKENRQ